MGGSEDDEIALDTVEHGHARERPPGREAEALEEPHAGRVMAEHEA